jgi:hypothetical protein
MALTYGQRLHNNATMNANTGQLPAHHPLHTRPSRIEARPVIYPQRRAPHHKARGRRGSLCGSRLCALWHQRHEFRVLLLYFTLSTTAYTCHKAGMLTMIQGYEWTRSFFEKAALKAGRASSKLTTVESMLAGALAGSATVLMTNPIWVVNTRMTTRKSEVADETLPGAPTSAQKAPSTLGTLFALVRDEGPARLFAGVMPALVLVINPILQYTVFEQLKQLLEKKRRVTPKDAFALGALGKLLATSITYPYITVKSRMHVAGRDGPREDMLTTFRRIIREEGYTGLYGGTSAPFYDFYRQRWEDCVDVRTCQALRGGSISRIETIC